METSPNNTGGQDLIKRVKKQKAGTAKPVEAGTAKPVEAGTAKPVEAGTAKPVQGVAKTLKGDAKLVQGVAKTLKGDAKLMTSNAKPVVTDTKPVQADAKLHGPTAVRNLQQKVDKPAKIVAAVSSSSEDMNEELMLLREILERQDKAHERELKKHNAKMEAMEKEVNQLQMAMKRYRVNKKDLQEKEQEKELDEQQMRNVMKDYEKTMKEIVAAKTHALRDHQFEKLALVREKELAEKHLRNAEVSVTDLHEKYERSKTIVKGLQENEAQLRESLAIAEAKISQQEEKYERLKAHAMQQLETANRELEALRKSQEADAVKTSAIIKKSELKVSSLQDLLDRKQSENEELTGICDDLIARVQ